MIVRVLVLDVVFRGDDHASLEYNHSYYEGSQVLHKLVTMVFGYFFFLSHFFLMNIFWRARSLFYAITSGEITVCAKS